MEGFLVKLDANSSVVVPIDVSCTLQFGKTAGAPNNPRSISSMWYRATKSVIYVSFNSLAWG